jgi:hypothetical protein
MSEIKVFNQNKTYNVQAYELEKVISKNSKGIARIEIQKVIERKDLINF